MPFTPFVFQLDGGMNQSEMPSAIPMNQLAYIRNMEYFDPYTLISRRGCSAIGKGPGYTPFPGRVTSLHQHNCDDGLVEIATSDDKVFTYDSGGDVWTDISGMITIPSNTQWMWRSFGRLAIGINQGTPTSTTNVVKWNGTDSDVSALAGFDTTKYARGIEIFQNRVVIITGDDEISGSTMGDPEDWATTGANGWFAYPIGYGDEDQLKGIWSWRGVLLALKGKRIFQVIPGATTGGFAGYAAGDPTTWQTDIVRQDIGCVSGWSIANVGDDVLFLSHFGVASMKALFAQQDIKHSIISQAVPQLARVDKSKAIACFVNPLRNQYYLSVWLDGGRVVYMADKQNNEDTWRWTTMTGMVAGSAYGVIINDAGSQDVWIGQEETNGVDLYNNSEASFASNPDLYSDEGTNYDQYFLTRVYDLNTPGLEKILRDYMLGYRLKTASAELEVTIIFDSDTRKTHVETYTLSHGLTGDCYGNSVWGPSPNAGKYISFDSVDRILKRSFGAEIGRRCETVQLQFRIVAQTGESIPPAGAAAFRFLKIQAAPLGDRYIGSAVNA